MTEKRDDSVFEDSFYYNEDLDETSWKRRSRAGSVATSAVGEYVLTFDQK